MSGSFTVETEEWDRACAKRTIVLPPYPVPGGPFPYVPFSKKGTLVKGDHHTDLPYTASWLEISQPFTGDYVLDAFLDRASLCPTNRDRLQHHVGSCSFLDVFATNAICTGLWAQPTLRDASGPLVEFLRNSATTTALANARSGIMNLPLLFADRVGTVNLFRDKVRQLCLLTTQRGRADLRRYMRTPLRGRRRVERQIASEHLAFLFGVLPLVAEIEGLSEILTEGFPDVIVTGRGKRTDLTTLYPPARQARGGNNGMVNALLTYKTSARIKVSCSLKYKVKIEGLAQMQKLGFNGLAVAYDLVPLSFLSDFISNTGNFLRAYDPMLGAEFSTGSWTLRRDTTVDGFAASSTTRDPSNLVRLSPKSLGGFTVTAGDMKRSVYAVEPEPIWAFQNNLTLPKAATIASLAIQRYLKPLRRVIGAKTFRYRGPRPKFLPPIKYR